MAAEMARDAAVQLLAEKLVELAGKEIIYVAGLKKEVACLKKLLEEIRAVLCDASKRLVLQQPVKLWLQNLEDLAYTAEDILDDINCEALCLEVELRNQKKIRNQMKRKVCLVFSFCNALVFRSKMTRRIKDLNARLEEFARAGKTYTLNTTPENSAISSPEIQETSSITDDTIVLGRENDTSKLN